MLFFLFLSLILYLVTPFTYGLLSNLHPVHHAGGLVAADELVFGTAEEGADFAEGADLFLVAFEVFFQQRRDVLERHPLAVGIVLRLLDDGHQHFA